MFQHLSLKVPRFEIYVQTIFHFLRKKSAIVKKILDILSFLMASQQCSQQEPTY